MITFGNIVQRNKISLYIANPTEIYTPVHKVVRGEHKNGDKYSILIKEMALPAGTTPEPVKNVSAIFWDEKIYLSWERSPGTFDSYNVILEDNADNLVSEVESYNQLNFIFDNSQSAIITNGNTYVLYVNKEDLDSSVKSAEVSGVPKNMVPQNPTVINEGQDSVEIGWDAVTGDVKSYTVYVRSAGTLIRKVEGITSTQKVIDNLQTDQTFDFTVTSVSLMEIFESGESASVIGSTDVTAPAAPTGLQSTNVTSTQIDIAWDANSETDLDGYNVYVSKDGGAFSKDNGSLVQTESYSITTVGDATYDIKITAVDTTGNESNYSSTITETTPVIIGVNTHSLWLANSLGGVVNFGQPAKWETDVLTQFTIELWVLKTRDIPGFSMAFCRSSFDYNDNLRFLTRDSGEMWVYMDTVDGNTGYFKSGLQQYYTAGSWVHFALTYSGSEIEWYRGAGSSTTLLGTDSSFQGPLAPTGAPWTAFARHGNNGTEGWFWNGYLDEIRIWDHVRTKAEIENNMATRINPGAAGLVGYYSMDDDGSPNVLNDRTANGYNASISSNIVYDTKRPFDN